MRWPCLDDPLRVWACLNRALNSSEPGFTSISKQIDSHLTRMSSASSRKISKNCSSIGRVLRLKVDMVNPVQKLLHIWSAKGKMGLVF